MYIYRTYFKLTDPVNDLSEAQCYLTDDDMTAYLKDDNRIEESVRNSITLIEWILKDEQSGYIELKSDRELSDIELQSISNWVSGQNSDGLGEGFEQQGFANYQDENYYDEDEEEDYDDGWIMASFDWQTNDYVFEFVRNE